MKINSITRTTTITHDLKTCKVGRYKSTGYRERDLYVYRLKTTTVKNKQKTCVTEEGFCWPISIREFRSTHKILPARGQTFLVRARSKITGISLDPFRAITTGTNWKSRVKITGI